VIRRLLRACALVPRAEFRVIEEKLRTARQRLEQTSERLAQAVAASDQLQQRRRDEARQHKSRFAEVEAEHARQAARAKDAAQQASQRIAALEDALRTRDAEREAAGREVTTLEQRVVAAVEELRTAREALAAIEVKLDILEGAANVLDSRTRTGPAVR
jgi:chromosome segregation ATPase